MLALMLAVAFAASPQPALAKPETQLVIEVKPPQVVIFLDNKKLGTAAKVYTLKVSPGDHQIRLTLKRDSSEEVVTVKKGQKKIWRFDMTDSGDLSPKSEPETSSRPEPEAPAEPKPAPSPSDSPPESNPDLR
jgi:hypothetical protein